MNLCIHSTILFLMTLYTSIPITICDNDDNPLMDIASSFLQNAMQGGDGKADNLEAIGSIVGSLMQAQIGDQGTNPTGDIMAGIGNLFANKDMKLNPNLIGSVISMFAQGQADSSRKGKRETSENDIDFGGLLNTASEILGNNNNGANILPLIMNTIQSFSGPSAERRAHDHKDHEWFLPPVLEKMHIYWDHFINSEIGATLWKQLGFSKILRPFQDEQGNINFEKLLRSFENQSFRRRYLKAATEFLTDKAIYVSNPDVLRRYSSSAQYIINSFLKSIGFPQTAMLDTNRPSESLTSLSNYVARKYLDDNTDTSIYIKPAIKQIQEILEMAQTVGRRILSRADLTDRLTDTLNLEVIEPILRVYRVYRHSIAKPQCQEHLMCLVNKHEDKTHQGLPGFKRALTKLSSFVASAVLSYQNGQGFWDLYNAIQSDVNCEAHYPAECTEFHEDEIMVTTEYYHNEL